MLNFNYYISLFNKLFVNKCLFSVKKNHRKNISSKYKSKIVSLGSGILLGIIISVLIMFILNYLCKNFNNHTTKEKKHIQSNKIKDPIIPSNNKKSPQIEKNYDFYKLLSTPNKNNKKAIDNFKKNILNKYLIEVAKLATSVEADALKAKLAFYGFEAKVDISHKNNDIFTVVIGPFNNKEIATKKKAELISYGFVKITIKTLREDL